MKYVTTNIRLPEDLWRSLKTEATHQRKRFSQIVRERLVFFASSHGKKIRSKGKSLRGLWKGAAIPDALIEKSKKALFPSPKKFLS